MNALAIVMVLLGVLIAVSVFSGKSDNIIAAVKGSGTLK